MRHLLLIDPIEKLNTKKDSSLMLALALQRRGAETYVLFEEDFAIQNQEPQLLRAYPFSGSVKADGIYLAEFKTQAPVQLELAPGDTVHMRLDPPFDSRYLRILWMLDHLVSLGINVTNAPRGIMQFNEKLYAYRSEGSVPSFVGANLELAKTFVYSLADAPKNLIIKPMDLYSGVGVEKLAITAWEKRFQEKVRDLGGPVIIQPFMESVASGEFRALYFKGRELGTILKVPQAGEFLSNIAQGASFHAAELGPVARARCEAIVRELAGFGVDFVAFDVLEDAVTEVNVTCPGLLVEVSFAYDRNLADVMADLLLSTNPS